MAKKKKAAKGAGSKNGANFSAIESRVTEKPPPAKKDSVDGSGVMRSPVDSMGSLLTVQHNLEPNGSLVDQVRVPAMSYFFLTFAM